MRVNCGGLWPLQVFHEAPKIVLYKSSLLRRLQSQTLPEATTPSGKIPPFNKIVVTSQPIRQFKCPSRLRIFKKIET